MVLPSPTTQTGSNTNLQCQIESLSNSLGFVSGLPSAIIIFLFLPTRSSTSRCFPLHHRDSKNWLSVSPLTCLLAVTPVGASSFPCDSHNIIDTQSYLPPLPSLKVCIYSEFTHVEVLQPANGESCTPQEVLLRMLFLRLDDSGSDEKLISPYCKECGSCPVTEQLCRRSIVCHNVVDAAGKKTGEKMLCRDCTEWLQPWLGMTREKAETSESDRQLNFLPDIQPGEQSLNQTPSNFSGDRGKKRNRNSLFPIGFGPDEWFTDEGHFTDKPATPSSPSAGSMLKNDAARYRNDGNPRQLKRARAMPRGSHNVPAKTGFAARHGIGRSLSSPRSERPGPNAPRVRRAPDVTREGPTQPAPPSDSYRTPRDSLPRNNKGRGSTPIKQEPAASRAGTEAPGLDRAHDDGKCNSLQFNDQTPRSKPSDNPAVDQPLQSAHRNLLSVAIARSNLHGVTTMDQKSVDIDDELTHAIRDGSFQRAAEAHFRRKSLSPDALMEEMIKKNMRIIPTLKLRGGTAGHHTPSATSAPPSTEHQTTTAVAARSSSSTVPPQQPAGAPSARSSTQPALQPTTSPSDAVTNGALSYDQLLAKVHAQEETILRLGTANCAKDDRYAVLAKVHAETQAEPSGAR